MDSNNIGKILKMIETLKETLSSNWETFWPILGCVGLAVGGYCLYKAFFPNAIDPKIEFVKKFGKISPETVAKNFIESQTEYEIDLTRRNREFANGKFARYIEENFEDYRDLNSEDFVSVKHLLNCENEIYPDQVVYVEVCGFIERYYSETLTHSEFASEMVEFLMALYLCPIL